MDPLWFSRERKVVADEILIDWVEGNEQEKTTNRIIRMHSKLYLKYFCFFFVYDNKKNRNLLFFYSSFAKLPRDWGHIRKEAFVFMLNAWFSIKYFGICEIIEKK